MARMAVIVLILGVCLPEVLLAGVVLEAGEIDSGKVRVGAFAEVVYGKGARDPVSGKWEKLVTASGYIKAVDAEGLTLALGEGALKEQIAFARIQRLLLAKSSRDMERLRKTTDMELPIARTDARSWRSEGRRVRIHTRGMEEGIVARVHRTTRDTLFLKKRIREKRPASIALTDISRLEVWQYREYHVKEGAIVGAAVGITTGLVALKWAPVYHPIIFLGPPLVGVVGGIFGAMIGALSGDDVWRTVDHLSPSTVEGRRRLSYRLSFRF